ncbi:hypothetical protein D9Q98_010338 [Chlorella vulgaris]|uniref:Uncharacterized protein n=1 Tax=Chlorella vulgaris TaxID=3077 RepID=A0A9D4TJY8_CHLVU|nr:hypothetical protein D9Q98_010338 [Chlorella vulgaris]
MIGLIPSQQPASLHDFRIGASRSGSACPDPAALPGAGPAIEKPLLAPSPFAAASGAAFCAASEDGDEPAEVHALPADGSLAGPLSNAATCASSICRSQGLAALPNGSPAVLPPLPPPAAPSIATAHTICHDSPNGSAVARRSGATAPTNKGAAPAGVLASRLAHSLSKQLGNKLSRGVHRLKLTLQRRRQHPDSPRLPQCRELSGHGSCPPLLVPIPEAPCPAPPPPHLLVAAAPACPKAAAAPHTDASLSRGSVATCKLASSIEESVAFAAGLEEHGAFEEIDLADPQPCSQASPRRLGCACLATRVR